MSTKEFYRAFEETHRGSRELIKKRLSVYLAFVQPLKKLYKQELALDIGCGRGEWLELLKEHGIQAKGVDLDSGMLKACQELNLNVEKTNGISYLKKQQAESFIIISAFHVVEHITIEQLQVFIQEALRVLKPGGLLIMETPNPENIKVATESFYLDPTHINPIPIGLLSFLPKFYGFTRTKVLRLQESSALVNQEQVSLLEVIEGVSPDYAVIAQKATTKKNLKPFNKSFAQDYGVSLHDLHSKFENRLIHIEDKAAQAEASAAQSADKAAQAEASAAQSADIVLQAEASAAQSADKAAQAEASAAQSADIALQAEAKITESEAKSTAYLQQYHQVINSSSWQITKPLRLLVLSIRWFIKGVYAWLTMAPASRPRRVIKKVILSVKHKIYKYPRLKSLLTVLLSPFPKVKERLKKVGSIFNPSSIQQQNNLSVKELTQTAAEIHQMLQNYQPINKKNNKLAIVSPMPPSKTGIADYVSDLILSLSAYYTIDIITDTINPQTNLPVYDHKYFAKNAQNYGKILYQIGNNSEFHWYMFDLIKKFPGIVVLHDVYLGDALSQMQINKGIAIWDEYLIKSYGYAAIYQKTNKGLLWAINKYPVNAPLIQGSKAIIVHSNYAKNLLLDDYSIKNDSKIYRLDQVHKEINTSKDTNEKELLVCSFGHLIKHKCIEEIILAWQQAKLDKQPNCRLVFVGEFPQTDYGKQLQKLIKATQNIEVSGRVSDIAYAGFLSKASLAIQLRKNSRGETSRAVLDCLAQGVPTIINNHGSAQEIPQEVTYKISNNFTVTELSQAILMLINDKSTQQSLSANAVLHLKKNHSPIVVAKKLQQIIERVYSKEQSHLPLEKYQACLKNTKRQTKAELISLANSYDIASRANAPPILYVDISIVSQNDLKTGIQRVVRSILVSLLNIDPQGVHIIPVYLTDQNGYYHYRIANNYMQSLVPELLITEDYIVEPIASDIFLGLDFNSCGVVEASKHGLYKKWHQRGVDISFIIYDILPLQFNDYFPENTAPSHKEWIKTIAKESSKLICISATVAQDVQDYLTNANIKQLPAISSFHLGADIKNSIPTQHLPHTAQKFIKTLCSHPSFLMVGTLEPRKGHLQVLKAFEVLWQSGYNAQLTIVGQEGWHVAELIKRIKKHPQLNKKLFWLAGASDKYLEEIYSSSTCLIAASEGEGFGLPLIEAAYHKIPIIARDIPIFKEVAGDCAYFFANSKTPETIANSIIKWQQLHQKNKHPQSVNMPWLTWQASTQQLLQCLHIKGNT